MEERGTLFEDAGQGSIWSRENSLFNVNTPVDDILEHHDFTLEELLDEEDILQEVKAVNTKLIEFLSQPETLEKLIDHFTHPAVPSNINAGASGDGQDKIAAAVAAAMATTAMSVPDALREPGELEISGGMGFDGVDAKPATASAAATGRGKTGEESEESNSVSSFGSMEEETEMRFLHKFPYIACEVVCCDSHDVTKGIITNDDLLERLSSILDQPAPIDPRLAGYFQKVMSTLVGRNAEYILIKFSTRPVTAAPTSGTASDVTGGNDAAADGESESGSVVDMGSQSAVPVVSVSSWFLDKLMQHLDNYSVASIYKLFLKVANGQYDNSADNMGLNPIPGNALRCDPRAGNDHDGDDDDGGGGGDSGNGKVLSEEEATNRTFDQIRSMWSGGRGTVLKLLNVMRSSKDSDVHANASEILVDLIDLLADRRDQLEQEQQDRLAMDEESQRMHQLQQAGGGIDALANQLQSSLSLDNPAKLTILQQVDDGWSVPLARAMVQMVVEKARKEGEGGRIADGAVPPPGIVDAPHTLYNTASDVVACLAVLTQLVNVFSLPHWSIGGAEEDDPEDNAITSARDDDKGSGDGGDESASKASRAAEKLQEVLRKARNVPTPPQIQVIVDELPTLSAMLIDGAQGQAKPEDALIETQWSGDRAVERVGMRRLRVLQLVCTLLMSHYPGVLIAVAACNPQPLTLGLDLFFRFQWNNVLHSVVCNMVKFALSGGVSGDDMQQLLELQRQQRLLEAQEILEMHGNGYPNGEGRPTLPSHDDDDNRMPPAVMRKWQQQQDVAQALLEPLQRVLFRPSAPASSTSPPTCKGLVDRLLDAYERNHEAIESSKALARAQREQQSSSGGDSGSASVAPAPGRHGQIGNMGHCHIIANAVEALARTEREAQRARDEVPSNADAEGSGGPSAVVGAVSNGFAMEATSEDRWRQFAQGELSEVNMVESCLLGGEDKPSRKASIGSSEMGVGDLDVVDGFGTYGGGLDKNDEDDFDHGIPRRNSTHYDDDDDNDDDDFDDHNVAHDDDLGFSSADFHTFSFDFNNNNIGDGDGDGAPSRMDSDADGGVTTWNPFQTEVHSSASAATVHPTSPRASTGTDAEFEVDFGTMAELGGGALPNSGVKTQQTDASNEWMASFDTTSADGSGGADFANTSDTFDPFSTDDGGDNGAGEEDDVVNTGMFDSTNASSD